MSVPLEPDVFHSSNASTPFKIWVCLICGFIYDEESGLPDEGLPPGTRWEDVPASWACPECGVGKEDFEMSEVDNS